MRNFDPSSLMIFFAIMVFAGIIDFPALIVMFIIFMFVRSANKNKREKKRNRRDYKRQERPYRRQQRTEADYRRQRPSPRRPAQPAPKPRPKNNPFKANGLKKYRDYDYEGAIEDFNKGLQINSQDVAIHFNLACAYSLTEQTEKSFDHLSKAVQLGFTDFDKIKTHDALAYLRIQDEFEEFVKAGYRWPLQAQQNSKPEVNIKESNDLLEQLNKLGELKERGLLTEEEFAAQKKRLLG